MFSYKSIIPQATATVNKKQHLFQVFCVVFVCIFLPDSLFLFQLLNTAKNQADIIFLHYVVLVILYNIFPKKVTFQYILINKTWINI